MILYLYGPDAYRRQQKLKELIGKYKEKHSGLTVEHFDLENGEEIDLLRDSLSAQSLFGGSRLSIIRCKEAPAALAGLIKLASQQKHSHLFIVAERHLGKDFNFLFKKPYLSEEFKPLIGAQFAAFIKKEAAKRGPEMDSNAINDLIRASGSDIWFAVNELDKLALGGKPEHDFAYPNFFSLLQRLKKSALASRLSALSFLLCSEEPAAVFNIMASQVDGDLKTKMADYDVAIKSGKLEYEEALLDLALNGY